LLCCLAEPAVVDDREEELELPDVHHCPFSSASIGSAYIPDCKFVLDAVTSVTS
jgi:hypothetical protein